MFKKIISNQNTKDLINIVFYILAGVLTFIVSGSNNFQITTNFLSNNSFASPNSTLFTPASRVLFSIEYRYVIIFLLTILIVKLAYRVICDYKKLKLNVKSLKLLNMYLDSLAYSLFIILICILAGLQDVSSLILVFVSSYIGICLARYSSNERELNGFIRIKKLGIILGSFSWLLIFVYSIGTLSYGSIRSTWYVYVLDIIGIVYFLFLVSGRSKLEKDNNELWSYVTDLLLKLTFIVILAIGLH